MKLRPLGKSGLLVSSVGLGTNNFAARLSKEEAIAVVERALDLGVTLFDTADSYGEGRSEELLAAGLGARRKDVVIATKWGNFRHPGEPEDPNAVHRGFHLEENGSRSSPLLRKLALLDTETGRSPSPGSVVNDGENFHLLPPEILQLFPEVQTYERRQ